jgi:hypothetical protein
MSARNRSPHGVYVTSNGGAFYYRQRDLESPIPSTRTIESADVGVLSDLSQDGFVTALNAAAGSCSSTTWTRNSKPSTGA